MVVMLYDDSIVNTVFEREIMVYVTKNVILLLGKFFCSFSELSKVFAFLKVHILLIYRCVVLFL